MELTRFKMAFGRGGRGEAAEGIPDRIRKRNVLDRRTKMPGRVAIITAHGAIISLGKILQIPGNPLSFLSRPVESQLGLPRGMNKYRILDLSLAAAIVFLAIPWIGLVVAGMVDRVDLATIFGVAMVFTSYLYPIAIFAEAICLLYIMMDRQYRRLGLHLGALAVFAVPCVFANSSGFLNNAFHHRTTLHRGTNGN